MFSQSSARSFQGFTRPLLEEQGYSTVPADDMEMLPASETDVSALESQCHSVANLVQLSAMPAPLDDRVRTWTVTALLLLSSGVLLSIFAEEWTSHPSQRIWLIVGSGYYILAVLKQGWFVLGRLLDRTIYLSGFIDRRCSRSLFEGITDQLQATLDKLPSCASRDVEIFSAYEKSKRVSEVKLRFWGQNSQAVTVLLHRRSSASPGFDASGEERGLGSSRLYASAVPNSIGGIAGVRRYLEELLFGASPARNEDDVRHVTVTFSRDGEVQTGRDAKSERKEGLKLHMRSRPATLLADKVLLRQWCEECMQACLEPPESIVEVYGLQQSSCDWMPEWQLERTRLLKDASGVGDRFYLERASSREVLFDARLWASSSLRIYMMLGPPGVGKSEFTVWLAGQLRLPIYRVSVNNPQLTDALLAQVFSQNCLMHDSVVVQLDEFQGALKRWEEQPSASGITQQGLCEVLQGSTTLSRGVVVVTGTEELGLVRYREEFGALYRRFNEIARISWLEEADIRVYFHSFLRDFVPAMGADEWVKWEEQFMGRGSTSGTSPWISRPVSLDMLKQFLMRQVTQAAVAGHGLPPTRKKKVGDDGHSFRVKPAACKHFCDLVCNQKAAADFLKFYAPVWKSGVAVEAERGGSAP